MLHLIRNAETVGNSWRNSDELATICTIRSREEEKADICHRYLQIKYAPKGLFRICNDLHDPLSRRRKGRLEFIVRPITSERSHCFQSSLQKFEKIPVECRLNVCFRLKLSHFLLVAKFFCVAKVQEDKKFWWQYGSAHMLIYSPGLHLFLYFVWVNFLYFLYFAIFFSWPGNPHAFFIFYIFKKLYFVIIFSYSGIPHADIFPPACISFYILYGPKKMTRPSNQHNFLYIFLYFAIFFPPAWQPTCFLIFVIYFYIFYGPGNPHSFF